MKYQIKFYLICALVLAFAQGVWAAGPKPTPKQTPASKPAPAPASAPASKPAPAPASAPASKPAPAPASAPTPTPASTPGATPVESPKVPLPSPTAAKTGPNAAQDAVPFIETYPNLKNYLYREPPSGFYFGIGASPIGILKDRLAFTINFFQIHLMTEHWNWEIFDASYGFTQAQSSNLQSKSFIFRTAPKFKITDMLSFGPLLGYEYVSFPSITSQLYKAPYIAPTEPFSSRGWIYGLILSESFHFRETYLIQINQMAFQETYSTTTTPENWQYRYTSPIIQADPSLIEASLVIAIEASFLY